MRFWCSKTYYVKFGCYATTESKTKCIVFMAKEIHVEGHFGTHLIYIWKCIVIIEVTQIIIFVLYNNPWPLKFGLPNIRSITSKCLSIYSHVSFNFVHNYISIAQSHQIIVHYFNLSGVFDRRLSSSFKLSDNSVGRITPPYFCPHTRFIYNLLHFVAPTIYVQLKNPLPSV